ncbi:AHH domain-containing protein [Fulvivirga sp. 29W222]|uniref:AHH domain-containing protein n=1 Tax=Fulvivirga marina TaxID=2494733 RepID=A0A937KCZ5_9BACT|nr:AHH domain-containing protein [Fulvivirga marina]MBL6448621.1 AHH domain-containing protein [Fulvivirga marina]
MKEQPTTPGEGDNARDLNESNSSNNVSNLQRAYESAILKTPLDIKTGEAPSLNRSPFNSIGTFWHNIIKLLRKLLKQKEETETTESTEETGGTGETETMENTEETEETTEDTETTDATEETEQTEETSEETTETTTYEPCTAKLVGPECVCVDEIHTYKVISQNCPDGKCRNWKIDNPSIAKITFEDNCQVKVLALSVGVFKISVQYLNYGQVIKLEKQVHVYKVEHVKGGTTSGPVTTTPLIQPHPFIKITSPDPTVDHCLDADHYKVHLRKLEQGYNQYVSDSIELDEFINQYFEVEVQFKGSQLDFFKETEALQWQINNDAPVSLLKNQEFTDTTFETKIPGEDNFNNRVVLFKGIGEFIIKFIALNAIHRAGTDWANVFISFTKDQWDAITKLKEELAVLIFNASHNPHGGHASAILNKQKEIKAAYYNALKNPCIKIAENHQENQVFALGMTCKTRTKVENDDRAGTTIQATVTSNYPGGQDIRSTDLEKQGATTFLTDKPVKNYWVTKHYYGGNEYDWDNDGLLKGEHDEILNSTYQCCGNDIDIFGVEIDSDDCVTINKNETITLKAIGLPDSTPTAGPGYYQWSVIAKPNRDAQADITPVAWNTSPTAQLKVDTSGIYTVKVEYMLGGRSCPLTYALHDIKVFFKTADQLQWKIRRLGSYSSGLEKHVDRPYYQLREQKPQLAAEMLIEPALGASGGSSATVIGKKFAGSFLIPLELAFSKDLTLRAYYKDFSPGLGSDDYDDFSGPPYVKIDPQSPMEAKVELNTEKDIHAIHLININYENLMRLKGQAVPIHFVNKPPDTLSCPDDTDTTEESEETTTEVERQDLSPLVNLLVYNRDLGNAKASNGFQLISNAGDMHNIPNGNVYLNIPVFETRGHGENLIISLSYNSLQASYQDSLGMLKVLNGLTESQVRDYYCENTIGKGWSHEYGIYIKEYIKPRTPNGLVLDQYAELVCPDGNRIQFVAYSSVEDTNDNNLPPASQPDSNAPVTYQLVYPGEHWMGNAEIGHSLKLKRETDSHGDVTYELKAINGKQWHFDKNGALIKITTPHIEGSSGMNPLTLDKAGSHLTVKDSSGRETIIREIPDNSTYSGYATILHPDNNRTYIDLAQGRVQQVSVASNPAWKFEYYDKMGELYLTDPGTFLRSIKDPNDVANLYEYYDGNWFHRIPQNVAEWFWGRLGRNQKAQADDAREHLWRYKPLSADKQEVVYRNPGNVEFVYEFHFEEMAVIALAYVPQHKDPVSYKLLGVPNYDQVLASGISLPTLPVGRYGYHMKTKLIARVEDIHKNITTFEYEGRDNNTTFLMSKRIEPDEIELKFEYNSNYQLWKKYNPKKTSDTNTPAYIEYKYDSRLLFEEVIYPAPEANGQPVKETWIFNANSGLLEKQTNMRGIVTSFKYGEGQRDLHGLKLPTSKSIEKTIEPTQQTTLTWEMTYDKMGRTTKSYDPVHGSETDYEYNSIGLCSKVKEIAIITYLGSAYGAETTRHYDGLHNLTSLYGQGGYEEWKYNKHGEIIEYRDKSAHKTFSQYHKTGALSKKTNPDGTVTELVIDELNRIVRADYPEPDTRAARYRSHIFTDIYSYDDPNGKAYEQRYTIPAVKSPIFDPQAYLVKTIEQTYTKGRVSEKKESFGASLSPLTAKYYYDIWGERSRLETYDGTTLVHTESYKRDQWGREYKVTEKAGSKERSEKITLDSNGNILENYPASFSTFNPGETPKSVFIYDELDRQIEAKDSYGNTTKKVVFQDFGNNDASSSLSSRTSKIVESSQDPSKAVNQGGLIITSEIILNRRGLVTEKYVGEMQADLKQVNKYDSYGRNVGQIDLNGTKTNLTLDSSGKPIAITIYNRQQKSNIQWSQFQASNAAHIEEKQFNSLIDYSWHGQVSKQRDADGWEEKKYDAFKRLITHRRRDGVMEQVTYDALGRIIAKSIGSRITHSFVYDDNNRQITATYISSQSNTRILFTYDWDHKLLEYKYLRNDSVAGPFENNFSVTQEYSDFGKLKLKKYFRGNREIARQEYEYNDADLRTKFKVKLSPVGRTPFETTQEYQYDANKLLRKIEGGVYESYLFAYNHGRTLKKVGRPMLGVAGNDFANTTSYDHDPQGNLTGIIEKSGKEGQDEILSHQRLFYNTRQKESWEQATPWSANDKDLLPDKVPMLRGMTLKRHFAEDPVNNPIDMFAQDLAYDGVGQQIASVTQFKSVPELLMDSRYAVTNSLRTARNSYRNIRDYNYDGGAIQSESNFTVTQTMPFGSPGMVIQRSGVRTPVSPKDDPVGFVETNTYFGPEGALTERKFVQENIHGSGTDVVSQNFQNRRRFAHDAMGRMTVLGERTEIRTSTNRMTPEDTPAANHSFEFLTRFIYGPEGEELFRMSQGTGLPSTLYGITLYDGAQKVAEYESDGNIVRYFSGIPGINTRLSATSYDENNMVIGHAYYRSDYKGTTLFTTDFEGKVVIDYWLSAPEGDRDLFGRTIGPGAVRSSERDQQRIKELWSFFVPAGPRIDMMMITSHELEQRAERIASQGLNPVFPSGGRNNYGFSIGYPHKWNVNQVESNTARSIAQGTVDFLRGMGDTISFGLTKPLREAIHGKDGEIINAEAYLGGSVAGIAVSVTLGFGVGSTATAAKASAWAVTAGRAYIIGGDIIGVAQSSFNIYRGKHTALDYLGFLPLVGFAASKAFQGVKKAASLYADPVWRANFHYASNLHSWQREGFQYAADPLMFLLFLIDDLRAGAYQANRYKMMALREAIETGELTQRFKKYGHMSENVRQKHHIATDKNSEFTGMFEELFERAGMTLNDPANKVRLIGHHQFSLFGHSPHYHEWVYKVLSRGTYFMYGDDLAQVLRSRLSDIGQVLHGNQALLKSNQPITLLL